MTNEAPTAAAAGAYTAWEGDGSTAIVEADGPEPLISAAVGGIGIDKGLRRRPGLPAAISNTGTKS